MSGTTVPRCGGCRSLSTSPRYRELNHQLYFPGKIAIVDHDIVDISNLQRQILHTEARVGMSKVRSAEIAIKECGFHLFLATFQSLTLTKGSTLKSPSSPTMSFSQRRMHIPFFLPTTSFWIVVIMSLRDTFCQIYPWFSGSRSLVVLL